MGDGADDKVASQLKTLRKERGKQSEEGLFAAQAHVDEFCGASLFPAGLVAGLAWPAASTGQTAPFGSRCQKRWLISLYFCTSSAKLPWAIRSPRALAFAWGLPRPQGIQLLAALALPGRSIRISFQALFFVHFPQQPLPPTAGPNYPFRIWFTLSSSCSVFLTSHFLPFSLPAISLLGHQSVDFGLSAYYPLSAPHCLRCGGKDCGWRGASVKTASRANSRLADSQTRKLADSQTRSLAVLSLQGLK